MATERDTSFMKRMKKKGKIMPTYKVHLNHIYEDDEWVEVEADNDYVARDMAESEATINDAYDHAMHTSTMILDVQEC
tara:strand:+ start:718 stop:951 length:234 start_codon:yes stop_codon:yes gene_type:complete